MWVVLFPVVILTTVFGLVAIIAVYSWQKEKERTRQLQLTAAQLGWSFAASAPLNMIAGLERFTLFNQGHAKEIKNFMYGEATGQRPEFSRKYILRGQDEQAIRRTFNDGLLSLYESYAGTCTDGGGNQLFVFRGGYRLQPHEIQGNVGLALKLMNLFAPYQ